MGPRIQQIPWSVLEISDGEQQCDAWVLAPPHSSPEQEMENYYQRPLPGSPDKFLVVTRGVDDTIEGRRHEETSGL